MKGRMALAVLVVLAVCSTMVWAEGQKQTAVAPAGYGTPGVFPLQKTLTLTGGIGPSAYNPANNPIVKMWEKQTNVHIKWVIIGTTEKRDILFASDNYPDWSFATGLWQNAIAKWMSQGIVRNLVPYLKQGYTPNLDRLFAKYPKSYSYCLNPKGELQALPELNMLEANYLEQNFMINKTWLDKLGLKVPTTTPELKQVLLAFKNNDPNGNGKKDELGFGFVANDGFAQHVQSMYGMWGLPTKNGIAVQPGGKCIFAPIQPGYKDFILYMKDLYANGLIDPEDFTQTVPDFNAKVDNPNGEEYGFIIAPRGYMGTPQFPNRGQFESISPLSVPGYGRPQMWVHPGYLATKNFWFMTDRDKYPKLTMAWIDTFYTFKHSIQARYGLIGQGIVDKNGIWTPVIHNSVEWMAQNTMSAAAGADVPWVFEASDYGKRLAMDPSTKFLYDNYYKYYASYKAKWQWDRPSMTVAEVNTVQTLGTDINKLWKQKLAQWITGSADINTEWDSYVQQMKKMGVDKYVQAFQGAEDRFVKSQQ